MHAGDLGTAITATIMLPPDIKDNALAMGPDYFNLLRLFQSLPMPPGMAERFAKYYCAINKEVENHE
tara:strand:+ start:501 stop:701 length:201 start_codon:yes stop_codon:yes gene_type:complete